MLQIVRPVVTFFLSILGALATVGSVSSTASAQNKPNIGGALTSGTENLTWVFPAVTTRILKFPRTLRDEPPVPFPAPEPYAPKKNLVLAISFGGSRNEMLIATASGFDPGT